MTCLLHIVGCKHAGKTRLIELLVPLLEIRLGPIGTLKYAERDHFAWEKDGTDTARHFHAGSHTTGIWGDHAFAVASRGSSRALSINDLIRLHYSRMALVLTEGFNQTNGLKIEVQRQGYTDRPVISDDDCLATYGDGVIPRPSPAFACGSETRLSDHIVASLERLARVN